MLYSAETYFTSALMCLIDHMQEKHLHYKRRPPGRVDDMNNPFIKPFSALFKLHAESSDNSSDIYIFFYPISPVFSPWMSHSQSSRQSFQSLRTAAHKSSSPSGWPWWSSLLTTPTAADLLFPLLSSNLSLSSPWSRSNTNSCIFLSSLYCLPSKVLRYF